MEQTIWIVTAAAGLTAVMTGVGALPFVFTRRMPDRVVGWGNAAAGGLMLAASFGLIEEGNALGVPGTMIGIAAGIVAIVLADRALGDAEGVDVAELHGAGAAKALLILGIMTAHSFAEGIGVGVSYASTDELGTYITIAIALHNVPEGLAIALVLVPRGTPVWKASLWAIFTSLPQPIMAAPAFLFVEAFRPFLPVGLGLAAGAMIWMVFAELMPDAQETISGESAATVLTVAFVAMLAFQLLALS